MLCSIVLALAALRAGLAIRRARLARRPRPRGARQRHVRLAKPAVALILVGFMAGPVSAVLLRGWTAFATLHGVVGTIAAGCFAAAAIHGRRLQRGGEASRSAHTLLSGIALLAAALAAVAGFVLLP